MAKEIESVNYGLEKIFDGAQDFLPLLGTDYVEFYVGNAKQAAHFYKTAFGFQSYAYKGLETGSKETVSYVLKQDKIRLVLTTPLNSQHPINNHIVKHGDGVKVVALWVEDARSAYEETTKRGAKSFMEPTVEEDEYGEVVRAGIYTYGETVHMFVERKNYNGKFLPGFIEWESDYNPEPVGLKYIDHMVGNVGWGEMNTWVKWYEDVMERRVVYYYGIFDNDRLVANGSDLKDKNSCFGSISSVINKSIGSSSSGVYQSSPLSDFSYYNLDGDKVELDFSKDLIVYTYSYKLGKLSKNLDKLILDLKRNNLSYNFIIISLDNIASKKH